MTKEMQSQDNFRELEQRIGSDSDRGHKTAKSDYENGKHVA